VKRKTYHRRVFGGKDAQWNGIDQGKARLHEGSIGMSLNATYDDNLFKTRDGQVADTMEIDGSVLSASNTNNMVIINAGTDIFVEQI